MIDRESSPKDVHGTKENDVLFLEASVIFTFRKGNTIAYALVVSGSLRKFLCIDHLHFQIKRTDRFTIFIRFTSINIVADTLMFSIDA